MPPSPQEKAFWCLLFRLRIVWSVVQFCFQYQEAVLTFLFERYLCTEPSPAEKVAAKLTDEEIQNNTARRNTSCHPERSAAESNCEAAPKAGSAKGICHSAQSRSRHYVSPYGFDFGLRPSLRMTRRERLHFVFRTVPHYPPYE